MDTVGQTFPREQQHFWAKQRVNMGAPGETAVGLSEERDAARMEGARPPLSAPRAGIPDAFKAEQTPVGRFSKPEASATADSKLLHLTHLETKPDAALNVAQHRRRQRLVVVGISFRTGKLVWFWSSVEVRENT